MDSHARSKLSPHRGTSLGPFVRGGLKSIPEYVCAVLLESRSLIYDFAFFLGYNRLQLYAHYAGYSSAGHATGQACVKGDKSHHER
jgi:hypothetical protein